MNYFEIMGLPTSFDVDEDLLRKAFYENSKKYHPDFHTMASEEERERVLEMSTLNNKAFNTLKEFDSRLKYILELSGVIEEGEKYELAPDFLMEMMDFNEELMDLQMGGEVSNYEKLRLKFNDLENNLNDSINNSISGFPFREEKEERLNNLKDLYYRKKYLLRIKDSLTSVGGKLQNPNNKEQ